ncbi:MAG: universal stress protein [Planctomycetaceae bacterium]
MSWTVSAPIVVPIDFSGMSIDAVRTACSIAERTDQVCVVHVVSNVDQIAPEMAELNAASDEEREVTVKAHFADFLRQHGLNDVQEIVLKGLPAEQITRFAAQRRAGLIVIPSHGYGGLKRLVLGSVAEEVIRQAICPVLVLRRQDAE